MADQTRVLLIEDEENLLNSLSYILQNEGFEVHTALNGEDGLALAQSKDFDLVLLDLNLPRMDGFEVAEELLPMRLAKDLKVTILTGSDLEEDIVKALDKYADDYIVKPVRPRVLMARIGAVLRRPNSGTAASDEQITVKGISINPCAFEARIDEGLLDLTVTEFNLLLLFAKSPGRAFKRSEIIQEIHGTDCFVSERSVDFQVHGLRKKLGDYSDIIATVRGVGFKMLAD